MEIEKKIDLVLEKLSILDRDLSRYNLNLSKANRKIISLLKKLTLE